MNLRSRVSWFPVLVGLGCASTGVGNPPALDTSEQALFEMGADSIEAGDTASSLVWVPLIGLSDTSSLTTAAAISLAAQRRTPLYFQPAGCLNTTSTDATTTFDFQGCLTGALGLRAIRGPMSAIYAVSAETGLDVTISAPSDLTVSSVPITLSAQASLSTSGTERRLTWNGAYHAERAERPPIDHTASYEAVYDASSQCLALSGSATTTQASGVGVESVLADYSRCGLRNACPQKGTLTLTRLPDRALSIVIEYSGGTSALVRVPQRDISVMKTLRCEQ